MSDFDTVPVHDIPDDAVVVDVREDYEWVAGHKVDRPPVPRITAKPPVPCLAIWSRRDGIVAPAAARGEPDESDSQVEFDCTHMAFGVSRRTARKVVDEIQRFLAEIQSSSRA